MKIAVRAPNWIGDGVMALPAIRALKSLYPGASIHIICKHYLSDIFQNLPGIGGIVSLPDRLSVKATIIAARGLREMGFELGILLTNSFASALLFKLAGIKHIAGYNRDCRGFLLNQRVPAPFLAGHHLRYYLHLVARISGQESLLRLSLSLS